LAAHQFENLSLFGWNYFCQMAVVLFCTEIHESATGNENEVVEKKTEMHFYFHLILSQNN